MANTLLQHQVTTSIKRVIKKTASTPTHALSSTKDEYTIVTRLQALLRSRGVVPVDSTIHEIIVNHAISSEKLGPGSLDFLVDSLLTSTKDDVQPSNILTGQHPSLDDIDALVDSCSTNAARYVPGMVKSALRLAGFRGKIIVEKTHSCVPSVELVHGYTFDLQPCFSVDFSFVLPRVACIDGFIESVSEIHTLLEDAASTKEPCVIVLRGASFDVINTLRVNYDRGSLRVVPLIARFDLEGMNTIVDVATVVGSDVVSSLKGELVSSIKLASLPVVRSITSFKGSTVIVEPSTTRSVAQHASRLRQRRIEEKVDDVGHLLDARIKSLSPNHVIIRLPSGADFVVNSQSVDRCLRAVISSIEHGMSEDRVPVVSNVVAKHHASMCKKTLRGIGAVIV